MSDDAKRPLNFRLGRSHKEALDRLAREQGRTVSQLVREVVEDYVTDQRRAAWEAEAGRTAEALAEAARDPCSDEGTMLQALDAALKDFAEEWVWEEGKPE